MPIGNVPACDAGARCRVRRCGVHVALIGAVLAAGAVSCVQPESRDGVPLAEPAPFTANGTEVQGSRWWLAFADAELGERVDAALAGSFTLAEAWQRLREARALTRVDRAALYPSLDGTGDAALRDGSDVDEETQIGLGLRASYEVDLWGRVRATVRAERLRTVATAEDYRAAAITLSAEVASTWYELAESGLQLELIASQIETNETVLAVLEKRFAVGQSDAADVLRQRQLVELTREQAVIERARFEVLEHRLAVLEGRPPQAAGVVMPSGLPELSGLPATGLPSELLGRRPDVRAALRRIEAADNDVAAAVRDQYPRIDLAAALSTSAENPAGLFDRWLASLAGQVVAPLYDGGRRRAEVEREVAVREGLLARYGQVVLVAFQEVEDALAQERLQGERLDLLKTRLGLARDTYARLRTQYLNGAADFIDVLTALEDQQQIERDVLTARLERVRFRIDLHRALAGGFETPAETRDGIREAGGGEQPASGGRRG